MENSPILLLIIAIVVLLAVNYGYLLSQYLRFKAEVESEKAALQKALNEISKVHNELVQGQIGMQHSIQELQDKVNAYEFKMRAK